MIHTAKTRHDLSSSILSKVLSAGLFAVLVAVGQPARSQMSPLIAAEITDKEITSKQSIASSTVTTAEQIERLDAARLISDATIESWRGQESFPRAAIDELYRFAQAYSDIGEQEQAIALLDRGLLIAQQSDEASGLNYPRLLARIAPYYNNIKETETARRLLEEATEAALTLTNEPFDANSIDTALSHIAEAYAEIDSPEITEQGLLTILYLMTSVDGPVWEERRPHVYSRMIEAFRQLDNSAVAGEGLTKLLEIEQGRLTDSSTDNLFRNLGIQRLVYFAGALGQHNSTDAARELLEQAVATVQADEDSGSQFYDIAMIASGYGYLTGDVATAETELANLLQTVENRNSLLSEEAFTEEALTEEAFTEEQKRRAEFQALYRDSTSMVSIAVAYSKVGNLAKAQAILGSLEERFQAFEEGGTILYLWPLAQAYEEIGDSSGQENILQKIFDRVPSLKKGAAQGVNIADVTPGYLGTTTLLEAYRDTESDAIALERLSILEDFFKEIRFLESGFSGQLTELASVALLRDDLENSHRLMTEAMQLVGTPEDQLIPDDPRFNVLRSGTENFEQQQQSLVLSRIASNYGDMQNEQVKAEGLEALREAATKLTDEALKTRVDNLIIRAYAGV